MSSHLEMAAHELERREIYHRRGSAPRGGRPLAAGRPPHQPGASHAASHTALSTQQPQRDVQAQLNELREELHRTRAELEQAAESGPPAASG